MAHARGASSADGGDGDDVELGEDDDRGLRGISHTRSSREIPELVASKLSMMPMIHRGQNRKCTDDQVGVNE